MDKKEPIVANVKSPFTGGRVLLCTKETTVKYRGEDITAEREYYRCEDTGVEFSDSKLDDDFMWKVFRVYCNKQGFQYFTDILPPKDSQLKWKRAEKEMHVVTKCLVHRSDELFGHDGYDISNRIMSGDLYIPIKTLLDLPVEDGE